MNLWDLEASELMIWGLVLHLMADWLFQNDWMAQNKMKRRKRGIAMIIGPWWSADDKHFRLRKLEWEIQLPRWPWRIFCRGQHTDYYGACVFCHELLPDSPYSRSHTTKGTT